jgi:hypothetical protein
MVSSGSRARVSGPPFQIVEWGSPPSTCGGKKYSKGYAEHWGMSNIADVAKELRGD